MPGWTTTITDKNNIAFTDIRGSDGVLYKTGSIKDNIIDIYKNTPFRIHLTDSLNDNETINIYKDNTLFETLTINNNDYITCKYSSLGNYHILNEDGTYTRWTICENFIQIDFTEEDLGNGNVYALAKQTDLESLELLENVELEKDNNNQYTGRLIFTFRNVGDLLDNR